MGMFSKWFSQAKDISDLSQTKTQYNHVGSSTGITYATNGETPRPSMTIVPSIDAFKTKYILSCGKVGDPHSHHHVVVKKAETDDVTVDGGDEEQFTDLTYTPYRVKTIHTPTKDTFIAETTATSPFGGILVCNNTAAMPLTFESPEEVRIVLAFH